MLASRVSQGGGISADGVLGSGVSQWGAGGVSGSAVSHWSEGLCALSITYKVLHKPMYVCHVYYIFLKLKIKNPCQI